MGRGSTIHYFQYIIIIKLSIVEPALRDLSDERPPFDQKVRMVPPNVCKTNLSLNPAGTQYYTESS